MRGQVLLLFYLLFPLFSWAQDGTNDLSFNSGQLNLGYGTNSGVNAIAHLSDGKILLAGNFTLYNGTSRNFIACIHPDGVLDSSFDPGLGANQLIRSMVIQPDGKILIGGDFTSYNGTERNRIARIHPDGSLDTSFDPGTGVNGSVSSIVLRSDGRILIGGVFTSINGTEKNRVAMLNTNGSLDASFNVGIVPYNTFVRAIALQPDGKILIGGMFTSLDGIERNRIARLNANGSLDLSFDAGTVYPGTWANEWVSTIALQSDGKILIGGNFTNINGVNRNLIARLLPDGTLDKSFVSVLKLNIMIPHWDFVNSIALQSDGKILVGGAFTFSNEEQRKYITRLQPDGNLDNTFDPGIGTNNGVNIIVPMPDGRILIGGNFTAYNDTRKDHIARINPDGSLDKTINPEPGANMNISSVALQQDGKILIGGFFTSYNGTDRNHIARLKSDGSLDPTFDPGEGANGPVRSMALLSDGKILIGGGFTTYNGTARNHIARLHPDGSLDWSFDPGIGASSWVNTIALQSDGKILIGGLFTSYNGTLKNNIARLNPDGSLDSSFDSYIGPNLYVSTIALQPDGKILFGGGFTFYSSTGRNGMIARLHPDGSLDSSFDPGEGANSSVNTLALQPNGKILIGGDFTSYNGIERNKIALIQPDGSLDSSFDPGTGATNWVIALALQPDGKILIAGGFTSYNSTIRNRIARIHPDGNLDSFFDPGTGADGMINTMALQPDGKIIIGGDFISYDNVSRVRINRLLNSIEPEKDEEDPVPDKETLAVFEAQCVVNFEDLTIPTATDNVDGTIQGTTDEGIFPITIRGSTIITWTYTDAAGNSSTQNQEILIADTEKPSIAATQDILQAADAGSCEAVLSISAPSVTDNCNTRIVANGLRSDGLSLNEPYPLGRTIIIWTAEDASGNQAVEMQQNISILDEEKPIIEEVSTVTQSAVAGSCGALININPPSVSDNCGNPVAIGVREDGLELSDSYPVGITAITWSAKDASGNGATLVMQTVRVTDDQKPTIIGLPGAIAISTDPGLCGSKVSWTAPTVTDNCEGSFLAQTAGPASGSIFPVGTTTVTYVATDASGNTSSESFIVRVTDDQKPTIIELPGAIATSTDPGLCGSKVSWSAPTVTDNCEGSFLAQTAGPSSGSIFPVGTTTVTYMATDASGNTSSETFIVKVTAEEGPKIIGLPVAIATSTDPGLCGSRVSWTAPTVTGNCEGSILAQTAGPSSGSIFPVGTTTVTYMATDASGNTSSESFMVMVKDDQKPSIIGLPGAIATSTDPGLCGSRVSWTAPTVTGNCEGSILAQTAGPSSGSIFPVGTTTVTYMATDASGNTSSESFMVMVKDEEAPTVLVKNYNLQLNNSGNATLLISDINNGSQDNCSSEAELIYSLSKIAFTIADQGENMVTLTVTDAGGNSSTANAKVNVLLPQNLKSGKLDFILFPNPALHETTVLVNLVEEAIVTIRIYDVLGKLVLENKALRKGGFSQTFHLDGLSAGLYMIRVESGNAVMTKRLIKK